MDSVKNLVTDFISNNQSSIIASVGALAGMNLIVRWIRRIFR